MAQADPRDTALALHGSALRMLRALRPIDVETGLGTARASALSVVVFGGPVGVGRLAQIEQVRAPTMTRIVDRLVRDGLVVRRRSPVDRRHVHVVATAKGVRLMEAGRARRVEALAKAMGQLDSADLRTLAKASDIMATFRL